MADVAGRPRGARLALLVAGLVIGLVVAACGGSSPTGTPVPTGAAAIDGQWLLIRYTTPGGTQFTVPSAVTPTLLLQGDAASGNAGCNTFTAIATVGASTITFSQVQSTNNPCQDPMATVEAAYTQGLNLASNWSVSADGKTLTMSGPNNLPQLVFTRGS